MSAVHPVRLERSGRIITLRINRPEALNAINIDVLNGLRELARTLGEDPSIRVAIVTGSGETAFSAGADLKELQGLRPERAYSLMRQGQEVLRKIERAPIPIIAAVNGVALGGGCELVLASTFPVLATTASLGLPESGLGLIPGYGGTQRLPRVVGRQVAAHLMLTKSRLGAERAYNLGITPVPPVAAADLDGVTRAIAEEIASQGPRSVRSILTALEVARDSPLDAGLQLETGLAALAIGGTESHEGIGAFFERRSPAFEDPEPLIAEGA